MWYKASSVIHAIKAHETLSIDDTWGFVPACPKQGNNIHCTTDYPDCEGKHQKCPQTLYITNPSGHPLNLPFEYYIESREGRIRKTSATLTMIIKRYGLNQDLLLSV